jgi:ubiquinone/menaquinone biosynthesis C-methylase UbiE
MELSVALRLIEPGVDKTMDSQTWADLGAGSGLFTKALSSIIPSGTIYGVDKDNTHLTSDSHSVQIQKIKKDFTHDGFHMEYCDGILMANSLHYVADKATFISRIKGMLNTHGVLIIVEYERDSPNSWVPYPIRFHALEKLMLECGFRSVLRIGVEPSVFDGVVIYSALIRQ